MVRELTDPPRLGDLAHRLGVVPSTLRLAFLAERGAPPTKVFAAIRQRRALAHLRDSTLTLESIARLCGYASTSHLSRKIRQVTGLPPGRLRARAMVTTSPKMTAPSKGTAPAGPGGDDLRRP